VREVYIYIYADMGTDLGFAECRVMSAPGLFIYRIMIQVEFRLMKRRYWHRDGATLCDVDETERYGRSERFGISVVQRIGHSPGLFKAVYVTWCGVSHFPVCG